MVIVSEPALKILVAGECRSTKANIINKFLSHFPSSAEVRRKSNSVHFMYYTGKNFKIQLHDVNDVLKIERKFYDEMDLVFFCYAAADPESLRSLEKLSVLMAEVKKEAASSSSKTKKEVQSFLVVDVGDQPNVAFHLDESMKDVLGIERIIEISFEDEESTSLAFQTIFDEIIPAKLEENSMFNDLLEESPPRKWVKTDLKNYEPSQEWRKPVWTEHPDSFPDERNLENYKNREELLLLNKVSTKIMELIKDDTLSTEEAFELLMEFKSEYQSKTSHSDRLKSFGVNMLK